MLRGVRALGYDMVIDTTAMVHLSLPRLVQLLEDRQLASWHNLAFCPRTCPSEKARLCTYRAWFARPRGAPRRSVLMLPLSASCLRRFLRFRMGCHGLPKETGSWSGVPRSHRHCPLCGPGTYGDEKHLVFECPHLQPLRVQYATLFPRLTMVQFLWQADLLHVAKFVCDALDIMLSADSPDKGQASDQP